MSRTSRYFGAGRHRAARSSGQGRRSAAAAISAALLLSFSQGLPAWAEEGSGDAAAGSGGATTGGQPNEGDGAQQSIEEASGQESAGQGEAAPEGGAQPEGQGKSQGMGLAYGGRATGPAPLVTLPDDPAYPVPAPPAREGLPEEVDAGPGWQQNMVCDPVDRPGLEAFGNLIGAHYGRPGYTTSRPCIDQRSEHYEGRALDWQLNAFDPADRRLGDAAVTWLTANDGEMARRFGIQSIIWNERVWHDYDGKGWMGYAGQSPHTDHVHFSFSWDGATMRTSWWTGVAVERPDFGACRILAGQYAAIPQAPRYDPCPTGQLAGPETGYADRRPGDSGAGVGLVQPLLEVEQTGVLDAVTRDALIAWQGERGIPGTGVLDQLTYAAALGLELPELPAAAWAVSQPEHMVTPFTPHKRTELSEGSRGTAVEVLQEALGAEVDGSFGPKTTAALAEFVAGHPMLRLDEATGPRTTALTWHLLEQRAHPTLAYRDIQLAVGDRGLPVAVLQEQLGVEADGAFGPATEQALQDAQAEAGLEATGIVDGATWAAADTGTSALTPLAVVEAEAETGDE